VCCWQIPIPDTERSQALGIAKKYNTLVNDAKTRDLRLVYVKEQFREVTKQQALDFQEELKDLKRAFYTSGPGASGIELQVRDDSHLRQEVGFSLTVRGAVSDWGGAG
jgi:dynein heavy chain, axonemal